jgi:hypothetical protein
MSRSPGRNPAGASCIRHSRLWHRPATNSPSGSTADRRYRGASIVPPPEVFSFTPTRKDPMRKLKLDVDTLKVESFVALPHTAPDGTVHGHFERDPGTTDCDGDGWWSLFGTCAGCPTVGTCVGPTYCCPPTWRPTCNPSCNASCPLEICSG